VSKALPAPKNMPTEYLLASIVFVTTLAH